MKTKKQLEKEIEELKKEQKELIEEHNLSKPHHAIDIWEMENVAEATLTQTNEIIEMIDDFRHYSKHIHNVDDCECCEKNINNIQEILTKIKGEVSDG